MASQERPPRRPTSQPTRPSLDLRKVDFDPHRLKLPQAAIVGFAIGIFFHACVIFAVLGDGSSAGNSTAGNGNNQPEIVTQPTASPTAGVTGDRTDCNAIRTTGDYRSETERQWFLANCVDG